MNRFGALLVAFAIPWALWSVPAALHWNFFFVFLLRCVTALVVTFEMIWATQDLREQMRERVTSVTTSRRREDPHPGVESFLATLSGASKSDAVRASRAKWEAHVAESDARSRAWVDESLERHAAEIRRSEEMFARDRKERETRQRQDMEAEDRRWREQQARQEDERRRREDDERRRNSNGGAW